MSESNRLSFLRKAIQGVAVLAAMLAFAAPGHAADPTVIVPGKDHPLVGRYEGSELVLYQTKAYDEAELIQGPTQWPQDKNNIKVNTLRVEGAVSNFQYALPEGRALLEVQRNYENSLKSKGFQILFTCHVEGGRSVKESSCFQIEPGKELEWPLDRIRDVLTTVHWPVRKAEECCDPLHFDHYFKVSGRLLFAKRDAPEGTTYVNLALSEGGKIIHGPASETVTYAFVRVVDVKGMDDGKITFVDASAMQKSLEATGRISLYGIYFDIDKDTIKPESKPTLDEIAKLMNGNPRLHVQVVGHTDSTGGDVHNKDLSNRRAASVVRALAQTGIDAGRFASRGAGASEPVAPNDNEAGRAKNRRVELVRM